jgi:hypothetical protein
VARDHGLSMDELVVASGVSRTHIMRILIDGGI